jgi:chaperonin GroES
MTVSLKPLGDRVVVTPKPKAEQTRSGIVLPDTASEKPQEGTVLSVGPGRRLENGQRVEMEVRQGDTVLFARYGGTEVKLDDQDYRVIRESDLLAVITNGQDHTEDKQ